MLFDIEWEREKELLFDKDCLDADLEKTEPETELDLECLDLDFEFLEEDREKERVFLEFDFDKDFDCDNLEIVLEFARGYCIHESFPISLYIEALLLHPSAIEKVLDYKTRIMKIADTVTDSSYLIAILKDAISKINPFDYDRIHFAISTIVDLITKINDEDESILMYNNHLVVVDILDNFAKVQNKNKTISFQDLIISPWEIISSNLTPVTVKDLIGLSAPLNIDGDQFYVYLVEKTMKNYITNDSLFSFSSAHMTSIITPHLDRIRNTKLACITVKKLVGSFKNYEGKNHLKILLLLLNHLKLLLFNHLQLLLFYHLKLLLLLFTLHYYHLKLILY